MKKLLSKFTLFLIIMSIMISCTNSSQIIEKECESFLMSQLNDPSSYQRVSIKLIDTVRESEHEEELLPIRFGETEEIFKSIYTKEVFNKRVKERDSVIKRINRLKENPKEDKIDHFTYEVIYRAKNSFGTLILKRAEIYYSPFGEPDDSSKFFLYSNK